MPTVTTHERSTWPSTATGTARNHYSKPITLALAAGTVEVFLRIHDKSTNGQARVLYAPSANGQFYATATEVIANQTSVTTVMGSKTSGLGAAGRVVLEVSASTGSDMESVEAEVITVWKPF